MVGCGQDLGRVLHHNDRIALVTNCPKHLKQPIHIQGVKSNGGLVQDIERRGQATAKRSRQLDPLSFSPGEGSHLPINAHVAQTHGLHRRQSCFQQFEQALCTLGLSGTESERIEPIPEGLHIEARQIAQMATFDLDRAGIGAQSRARAGLASYITPVASDQYSGLDLVTASLEPVEKSLDPIPSVFVPTEHPLALSLRQSLKRNVRENSGLPARRQQIPLHGLPHGGREGGDGRIIEAFQRIGNYPIPIHFGLSPKALTIRASTQRTVEAQPRGIHIGKPAPATPAREASSKSTCFGARRAPEQYTHLPAAAGKSARHGFGEPHLLGVAVAFSSWAFGQHQTVDKQQAMAHQVFQSIGLRFHPVDQGPFSVDHSGESLACQTIPERADIFPLAGAQRRCQLNRGAGKPAGDSLSNADNVTPFDQNVAVRTARLADLGEQQAQVVQEFRRGPDRAPRIAHPVALLDGNRWRETGDSVNLGPG